MLQLSDFIQTYSIDTLWCEKVLDIVRDLSYNNHKTEGYQFEQLELHKFKQLQSVNSTFCDVFITAATQYFELLHLKRYVEHTNFSMLESVRVKRYRVGSKMGFDPHVDVVDADSSSRYLTAILYLNDNDGDTIFFPDTEFQKIVKPEQGSIVVFPPMWMFPHKANTPTTADKYIMMTSLRY